MTIHVPASLRSAACLLVVLSTSSLYAQFHAAPWDTADAVVARVKVPVFGKRTVDITRYGAKGDGATDCTRAFADAIAACAKRGGGRVVVPRGIFRTGPITLRSGIELHLLRRRRSDSILTPRSIFPLCTHAGKVWRS